MVLLVGVELVCVWVLVLFCCPWPEGMLLSPSVLLPLLCMSSAAAALCWAVVEELVEDVGEPGKDKDMSSQVVEMEAVAVGELRREGMPLWTRDLLLVGERSILLLLVVVFVLLLLLLLLLLVVVVLAAARGCRMLETALFFSKVEWGGRMYLSVCGARGSQSCCHHHVVVGVDALPVWWGLYVCMCVCISMG